MQQKDNSLPEATESSWPDCLDLGLVQVHFQIKAKLRSLLQVAFPDRMAREWYFQHLRQQRHIVCIVKVSKDLLPTCSVYHAMMWSIRATNRSDAIGSTCHSTAAYKV